MSVRHRSSQWLPVAAIALIATLAALLLAACGSDDDPEPEPTTSTTAQATGCGEVQTRDDVATVGDHSPREFTAADYPTNPPTGGDHNPQPLEVGSFYAEPPPLGESVHALEHGAVIGWTNGLEPADQEAVEKAFNEVFADGYSSLAVVEHPDLDGPFALSTWDSYVSCESVDIEAIRPFIEEHYAPDSSAEGGLACSGPARKLPACEKF